MDKTPLGIIKSYSNFVDFLLKEIKVDENKIKQLFGELINVGNLSDIIYIQIYHDPEKAYKDSGLTFFQSYPFAWIYFTLLSEKNPLIPSDQPLWEELRRRALNVLENYCTQQYIFGLWNISDDVLYFFSFLESNIDIDKNYQTKQSYEIFRILWELFRNGVFQYKFVKNKIIVLTLPQMIFKNNRLHSETEPAIKWQKTKLYFLHGVRFDEYLWKKVTKRKLKLKDILDIENIEQRMVALRMMDAEKLLKEAKAELIDKSSKGNELYVVEDIFRQPAYFLKYQCPSTGRVYISGIKPQVAETSKNADVCMAWKLGINPEDYQNIREA
jgi:hypothetical protein